jgi:hypothetical protein
MLLDSGHKFRWLDLNFVLALVMPLHHFVFTEMLRGIARASEPQIISGPEKLEVSPG